MKKLSLGILLIACLAGCTNKAAFTYNEDFVKQEKVINKAADEVDSRLQSYIDAEKYDSVQAISERMEKLIDGVTADVKAKPAPDVKEGSNFKDACIKYLGARKGYYTAFKEVAIASPEERSQKIVDLGMVGIGLLSAVKDIQASQKKYAEANGFKIVDK